MDVESWTMDTDDGNVNGDGERVGCWLTWRSMRAHVREAAAQLILQIGWQMAPFESDQIKGPKGRTQTGHRQRNEEEGDDDDDDDDLKSRVQAVEEGSDEVSHMSQILARAQSDDAIPVWFIAQPACPPIRSCITHLIVF